MPITIIKSKVEHNGKTVNRYQVYENDWDNKKELPVPAKLTYSYKKAMEIAGKILCKKFVTVVETDKQYKEADIVHTEAPSNAKK